MTSNILTRRGQIGQNPKIADFKKSGKNALKSARPEQSPRMWETLKLINNLFVLLCSEIGFSFFISVYGQ